MFEAQAYIPIAPLVVLDVEAWRALALPDVLVIWKRPAEPDPFVVAESALTLFALLLIVNAPALPVPREFD